MSRRYLLLSAALVCGLALLALRCRSTPPVVRADERAVTWRHDIAPILYANCTSCHHAGGSAPFALLTYAQARRWAGVMKDVTASRYMPPWLPAPGHGDFADVRRLTTMQIESIQAWGQQGMAEGTGPAPQPPAYPSEWALGKPDLILEMHSPLQVPASGEDLYVNFILPVPIQKTRWVRAMEIKPGSPTLIHHANVIIDRTASLRRQHPTDWQNGVPGMDLLVDSGEAFDPDSHFLFWKQDSTALVEPPGMPWRLDPGNDLILNTHLKPTGKVESVQARIALYFTDQPATQTPMLLQLEDDDKLDIPAGDKAFVVEDQLTLPVGVSVLGVYPHAHYLGKQLEGWAILPNGQKQWLVLIEHWDINRQSVYRYAHPLHLPASTVLHMRYTYDNSADNVQNPNSPPIEVKAGNRSADEMGHLWLQVLPDASAGPNARQQLEAAWMQSRLRKDPTDSVALYNLASLAMMQGNPARAAALYQQALLQRPNDPRTHTSAGSALAAEGDWQSAQAELRKALALDATYADALYDLAQLDLQHDNLTEAETLLVRLTTQHPNDLDAQRSLALAYGQMGELVQALTPLQAWAGLATQDAEPHRALAQVYSSLGRDDDALDQQHQVLALDPRNANDWNDLAMLEARHGDMAAARRDLLHALQLDPASPVFRANLAKLP